MMCGKLPATARDISCDLDEITSSCCGTFHTREGDPERGRFCSLKTSFEVTAG